MEKVFEYNTTITIDQYVIRDHIVQGVNILPGVAFFDMIVSILNNENIDYKRISFRNITFRRPIATDKSTTVNVRINCELNENKGKINISSGLDTENKYSDNFNCEFYIDYEIKKEIGEDINLLKNEAFKVTDLDEAYKYARLFEINHKDFMKPVGKLYHGKNYILSEVRMSDIGIALNNGFYMNTVFLDSATLVPTVLRLRNRNFSESELRNEKPGIPLYIEELEFIQELGDKCYALVKEEDIDHEESKDIQYSSITILNSDGKVAIRIKKLALKTIRDRKLIENKSIADEVRKASKHQIVNSNENIKIDDIENFIKSEIGKMLNVNKSEIASNKNFYELGMDSKNLVDIVTIIETKLDLNLYPTLLFEYSNSNALTEYLQQLLKEKENSDIVNESVKKIDNNKLSLIKEVYTECSISGNKFSIDSLLVICEESNIGKIDFTAINGSSFIAISKDNVVIKKSDDIKEDKFDSIREIISRLSKDNINIGILHINEFRGINDESYVRDEDVKLFNIFKQISSIEKPINVRYIYLKAGAKNEYFSGSSSLARTFVKEKMSVSFKSLVYDTQFDSEIIASSYISEFFTGEYSIEEIYYRNGIRYRKDIEIINPSTEIANGFNNNDTYIITGGNGKIGRILCNYLTDKYDCTIILLGRSDINSDIKEYINSMVELNKTVMYRRCNISNEEELNNVIEELNTKRIKIDGIIHCAGIVKDSLIINKKIEDINEVFMPKIKGTENIIKVVNRERVRKVILFSSLSSIFGNIGQGDYAFANGCMNKLAFVENSFQNGCKYQSVAWPLWINGGMTINGNANVDSALKNEEALEMLEKALVTDETLIGVIKGDFEKAKPIYNSPINIKYKDKIEKENNKKSDDDIAIIGLAGRYPGAETLDEFWKVLCEGTDCITDIPRERDEMYKYCKKHNLYKKGGFLKDIDKFDTLFFNISPREAEVLDPQERIFLETAWHTFEDAGYCKENISEKNIGVYVGAMYGYYQFFNPDESIKDVQALGSSFASIANRVSYFFNLHGVSLTLDTMCSSSLTALHLACNSLRDGESEMALVGGVNLTIHPHKYKLLGQGHFLSKDGRCRSFGKGGTGYVPGEGVGAVLLKPLKQAIKDKDNIQGVIKAIAINHGGKSNGYTVPNPLMQSQVIEEAIKNAGIRKEDISYIEAHGTGTNIGDPIEVQGINRVFKGMETNLKCPIGSVKSNIGHLESAAGMASITKVLLQMKHKYLVPSIHSRELNENIDFNNSRFYVQQDLEPWTVPEEVDRRICGINAFGAGGVNCHVIMEEFIENNDIQLESGKFIFVLSAQDECVLKKYAREFINYIISEKNNIDSRREEEQLMNRISYTLKVGREPMKERLSFSFESLEEVLNKLDMYINDKNLNEHVFVTKENKEFVNLISDYKNIIIKELINNQRVDKICKLWSMGLDINWNQFYKSKPSKISLPIYPFNKDRYWIGKLIDDEVSKGNYRIHELVDKNISTFEGQIFEKQFTGDEFYLKDHVINGNKMLPGSIYVEMARVAIENSLNNFRVNTIENVTWVNPYIFDYSKIKIELDVDEDNIYFSIYSEKDNNQLVHCTGNVPLDQSINGNECIYNIDSIQDLISNSKMSLDGATCYKAFLENQFKYGDTFKTLDKVYMNKDKGLSKVKITKSAEDIGIEWRFDPMIIDAAFQSICSVDLEKLNNNIYLPYRFKKLEVYTEEESEKLYSIVEINKIGEDFLTFEITLLNENQDLYAKIFDFEIRLFERKSSKIKDKTVEDLL